MGKFLEGWERAHAAAEEREAEKRRRAERTANALKELAEALAEDKDELAKRDLHLRVEHGALVLRRAVEPMAGMTFDPDTGRFRIHTYAVTEGNTEIDAESVEECALKLGEYVNSLRV
ncbi:MAG: hypothetical protein ACRED5_07440 [Propylenella sp.]